MKVKTSCKIPSINFRLVITNSVSFMKNKDRNCWRTSHTIKLTFNSKTNRKTEELSAYQSDDGRKNKGCEL